LECLLLKLLLERKNVLQEYCKLFSYILSIPASIMNCERIHSLVEYIDDDHRASLLIDRLDKLLRVVKNSPQWGRDAMESGYYMRVLEKWKGMRQRMNP